MDLVISDTYFFWWNYKFFKKKIMNNKILPFLFVIIFGFTFIIFYKSLKDSSIYTPDTSLEKEIPIFNAKNFFSRENIKSSNIFKSDKIYLLNIWSSWCVPCRQEHPLLMNLNLHNKVNIIGMNYKDDLKNANIFLKELGNPYNEIFLDLDGTIAIEWGAYGVPESFLIHNNKVIRKYIGPLNEKLIDEIKLLIK